MAREMWLLGLGALAIGFASLWLGINGDAQYVIGGGLVAVTPDGSPAGIDAFTHRPLVYRTFMVGTAWLLGWLQLTPADQASFEIGLRLVADFLAMLAAMLLVLALRPRLGGLPAAAIGLGVGGALVLAPNFDFLQAEWLGSLLAVMAIATALLPRSLLVAGGLSGLFLVLAAAAKLSTAPYAVIAFVLIVAWDRRLAVPVFLGGLLWGLAFIGLVLVVPHELRWMRDTLAISGGDPWRTFTSWGLMASAFASKAAVAPALMVAPAALLVVLRLAHPSHRGWILVGAMLSFALAAVPLIAQLEAYIYRLAVLPILCAGLVGLAIARLWMVGGRSPWWGIGAMALASMVASALLSLPQQVRADNAGLLLAAVGVVTLGLALPAWFLPRPGASLAPPMRSPALLATVGVLALALPALLPSAAWGLDPARSRATNASWITGSRAAHERLSTLSLAIGPESEVLYLAYGDVGYHMGNPVECRYPSPIFLKVGARKADVRSTPSHADNLACFLETDASWLIVQPGWLSPEQLPPDAQAAIGARFDCSRALTDGAGMLACPAR